MKNGLLSVDADGISEEFADGRVEIHTSAALDKKGVAGIQQIIQDLFHWGFGGEMERSCLVKALFNSRFINML